MSCFLLLLFLWSACFHRHHLHEPAPPIPAKPLPGLVYDTSFKPPAVPDFTIDSIRIHKDTLICSLTYSGGCREHDFRLIFRQSSTRDLYLLLEHQAHADACREIISKTYLFSLKDYPRHCHRKTTVHVGEDTAVWAP